MAVHTSSKTLSVTKLPSTTFIGLLIDYEPGHTLKSPRGMCQHIMHAPLLRHLIQLVFLDIKPVSFSKKIFGSSRVTYTTHMFEMLVILY
jgi:hypothetical protein